MSWIVLIALGAQASAGCLSHEHRISRDELQRLVQIAPERRGERVRVLQSLGSRRGAAVEGAAAPTYDHWDQDGADVALHVHMSGGGGGHWRGGGHARGGGWSGPGARPVVKAGPAAAVPTPSSSAPGAVPAKVGSGMKLPSGGGDGEALVVLAVVVVAVAALAAVGLAVTEGIRFDGEAAVWAGQPVYVKKTSGEGRVVPLAELTAADVADAKEAILMDDEGYGLRQLARAPLDRKGFAFKLDVGLMDTPALASYSLAGFASNVQLGYFPHNRIGVLGTAALGGGSDGRGGFFARHALGGEVQAFPLSLGPVHLGAFGNVGKMLLAEAGARTTSGLAFGGGALVELEATTRLALTLRAGMTAAQRGDGWAPVRTLSFGLAVY